MSLGEKQLLCVARALLRRTNVLILDEATASIDMENDQLIVDCIRKQFANATVLAIAHRLSTIIDYDRIMVLDKGNLVEFDEPAKLLERDSLLLQLVNATGANSAEYLKAAAIESANKRKLKQS